MYFFDRTSDLAVQPPCRRMRDRGMPRALHSDADPARMQCNVHFRPGGGRLLSLVRVSERIFRSREVEKPDFSQGRRHMRSQAPRSSRRSDRKSEPESHSKQQVRAGVSWPQPICGFHPTTQTLYLAMSEMQISVTEEKHITNQHGCRTAGDGAPVPRFAAAFCVSWGGGSGAASRGLARHDAAACRPTQ